MAVMIEANYAKKMGLPNYSSHQYGVTIRSEINDLADLEKTNSQLYALLQKAVDSQIEEVGFMPAPLENGKANGHRNGKPGWLCSPKQKEFILKLSEENKISLEEIDELAMERFGSNLTSLNRLQTSGLIDELLEKFGQGKPRRNAFKGGSR